jgi:hypothetical protein
MTDSPDQPLTDDDITGDSDPTPPAEQDADGVDQGQDADTQDHGGGTDTDSTDGVDADGTDSAS